MHLTPVTFRATTPAFEAIKNENGNIYPDRSVTWEADFINDGTTDVIVKVFAHAVSVRTDLDAVASGITTLPYDCHQLTAAHVAAFGYASGINAGMVAFDASLVLWAHHKLDWLHPREFKGY